jgi:hypothetical protein
MSDALSYATAAPGVPASRYGRRLRQRDFNNASETFTVLETPSSSVVTLKTGPAPYASSSVASTIHPSPRVIQVLTAFQNT